MSGINIQNVLDQLSTLAGAADSTQSVTYLSGLSNAILQANNLTGVIEYTSRRELPTPVDSSLLGKIFYVSPRADYANDPSPRSSDSGGYDSAGGVDTYGAFYYGKELSDLDSGYERIRTTKDDGPPPEPWYFMGENYGYSTGGHNPSGYSTGANVIEKYSFSSDGNATDVGDLTISQEGSAGQSSATHGYHVIGQPSPSADINKFSFASDGNATNIATTFLANVRENTGHSSETNGYSSGGYPTTFQNTITRFPFAEETTTVDVGDLSLSVNGAAGQSSQTHGYSSTGEPTTTPHTRIDKFAFASDGNATNVGDTTQQRSGPAGQNSSTHGYTSGGDQYSTNPSVRNSDIIDKFPFAADGNSTDVGDLTITRGFIMGGSSSTSSGYSAGGRQIPSPYHNVIDKFPFASDANATDVGDMTAAREKTSGQQY